MARRREGTRWIAVLATLALVVQALLSGFSASAMVAVVDADGNVICSSHRADTVDTADPSHHDEGGHRPNCCIVGCTFAAALAPPAHSSYGIVIEREMAITPISPSPDELHPLERRGLPGIPRAPPLMA